MSYSGQKVWNDILGTFKGEVSSSVYKTWFSGSHFLESKTLGDRDILIVGVKNSFLKEQIESRYQERISQILKSKSLGNCQVIFIVSNKEQTQKSLEQPLFSGVAPEFTSFNRRLDGLNPGHTFSNFVTGPSNNLAFLSATGVSANLGKAYNPLFIYGSVGVGKTHLIQAVGNDALSKFSNIKVAYVTCEKFTNDYIESLKNRTQGAFRQKYRSVDILLVDDVQFLAGKESTQDEFFHTFNELHMQGKQIVLASDRHPRELGRLNERLVSRFLGGMAVDVGNPDLELKIAILRAKCKASGITLSDEVVSYIVESCGGSVRELEGILVSTLAQIRIMGENFNIDQLKKNVDVRIKNSNYKPSVSRVLEIVAKHFKVNGELVRGQSRRANIVSARQVVMYLLRKELGLGLENIGGIMGGRDHSTVIHGINKVEKSILNNPSFKDEILRIKEVVLKK